MALVGAVELIGLDLGPEGRQLRCHGVLALETAVGLAALSLMTGHLQGMLVLFAVRGNAHLIGWLPDLVRVPLGLQKSAPVLVER